MIAAVTSGHRFVWQALSVLALFFALSTGTAHAQFGFGGDAPIMVKADKATYKGGLTILEGNVDVRQGETQIVSDSMDLYRVQTPAGASEGADASSDAPSAAALQLGAVNRIDAKGNFRYASPGNTVTGEQGVYEREKGVITVTGNVIVTQPSGNVVTAEKLTYNVADDTIRFADDCVGAGCPKQSGRVSLSINR